MNIQKSFVLNSFQQMMLKWNTLAPYNAGHVIHLKGEFNLLKWKEVVLSVINKLGLGEPIFNESHTKAHFKALDYINIDLPEAALDTHISSELNKPFLPTEFPIRFFIIADTKHSYFLGAIYNHWLADSYSMRVLFQCLYNQYHQVLDNSKLTSVAFSLDQSSFKKNFHSYLGKFHWWIIFTRLISSIVNFHSVYRIKLNDILDFNTGFERFYLSSGLIDKLIQFSEKNKVSINDIFLTTLAKILGEFTAEERTNTKKKKLRWFARNRIALGTIVDIRNHADAQLQNTFGQYLSNFTIFLKNPENKSFNRLLKIIHKKTSRIKKTFATIKNYLNWDVSLMLWKHLETPKRQARFFNKSAPIIAGISNVNLTDSWIGEGVSSNILDYIRISPTGLLLPLTFTLTTIHSQLSLCISYRTTAFSKEAILFLFNQFKTELERIEA